MLIVAFAAAGLAAAVHVAIFWLESIAWLRPETRAIFGIASEDDARVTRALAFNQGFYNLLLAIVTVTGIVLTIADLVDAGKALVLAGCGSMVAAALVLLASGGLRYARAAVVQGLLPLVTVTLLVIDLVSA